MVFFGQEAKQNCCCPIAGTTTHSLTRKIGIYVYPCCPWAHPPCSLLGCKDEGLNGQEKSVDVAINDPAASIKAFVEYQPVSLLERSA